MSESAMLQPTSDPLSGRIGAVVALSAFFLIAAANPAAAQAPSFTIDAALGAPFPSGLVASPAGGRVAWIFDDKGSRNIWVAEPDANGSYTSKQLTPYTGDAGIEIGTPVWSSTGERWCSSAAASRTRATSRSAARRRSCGRWRSAIPLLG